MLDTFITWAQHIQSHTAGPSLKIQLTENEEPENRSARLDFDAPFAIARITFWNSGDYDTEVIARETRRPTRASDSSTKGEISRISLHRYSGLSVSMCPLVH
ncbi:hypothetical protein GCM10023165_30320 [Variovorax defluvii]|uniref:Uncharacterized protein n=1 Tax=Variovorax defluvii TaxID=913761 RepID=A0ABP8HW58_9BURK